MDRETVNTDSCAPQVIKFTVEAALEQRSYGFIRDSVGKVGDDQVFSIS